MLEMVLDNTDHINHIFYRCIGRKLVHIVQVCKKTGDDAVGTYSVQLS